MLQHPALRISIRTVLRESFTPWFTLFSAAIMAFWIVLGGMGGSGASKLFSDEDRILVVSNALAPRYPLPVSYADEIRAAGLRDVIEVAAVNFVPATMAVGRQSVAALAASPALLLQTNTDLVVFGQMAERWIEDRSGLLVGRELAERERLRVGDSLSLSLPDAMRPGRTTNFRFQVRGIYSIRDDAYPALGVVMHDTIIRPIGQQTTRQGASAIMVLLGDRARASAVAREIDAMYGRSQVSTRTALREQYVETFNTQANAVAPLIQLYGAGGLCTAALLLASFSYFVGSKLSLEWRGLELLGFARRGLVTRTALVLASVFVMGATGGLALTWLGSILFSVAIEAYAPFFSIDLARALGDLGAFALCCLALSIAFLGLGGGPLRDQPALGGF